MVATESAARPPVMSISDRCTSWAAKRMPSSERMCCWLTLYAAAAALAAFLMADARSFSAIAVCLFIEAMTAASLAPDNAAAVAPVPVLAAGSGVPICWVSFAMRSYRATCSRSALIRLGSCIVVDSRAEFIDFMASPTRLAAPAMSSSPDEELTLPRSCVSFAACWYKAMFSRSDFATSGERAFFDSQDGLPAEDVVRSLTAAPIDFIAVTACAADFVIVLAPSATPEASSETS